MGFSGSSYVFTNPPSGSNDQQQRQEARITYDQQQIYGLNKLIDKAAEHPVSGSAGVYEIIYFAGLTESPLDEYDSAEAEEMEGLLAAQRSVFGNSEKPQLKVIVANGGAKMQDAKQVADMIIRRFRGDRNFLGVVGLDRSTGAVKEAIKDFSAAHIPVLATTLSADGIGDGSPYYFSLSPTNTDQARLMLAYIQQAVPRYFKQPASVYPSNGFITAQQIVIYQPKVTDQPDNYDDLYISTLVSDLQNQARNYRGLPSLTFTNDVNDSRLCGAATVDIYAGRHDRPIARAPESRNDDFTQFLTRIGHCKNAMPFVIADDGVARFVADPADRSGLDAGPLPISYVTEGINILSTGTECLSQTTAATVTAQPLASFCTQYAKIATALREKGINLLWTGERVGLAYDAAQMFLQAAETYWRTGAAIKREEIPGEFENPDVGYNMVTGSVSFNKTLHTGVDTQQGMPLAVVRILISDPRALPACAFTGFNGDQLSSIPNLDNQQEKCVDGPG
ncbi:MAG TPA: ABC transporter substrate-binding protein [Streptosporangiaceae bacterium]